MKALTYGVIRRRAAVKTGLMNLTYNMRRMEFLAVPQPAWSTA